MMKRKKSNPTYKSEQFAGKIIREGDKNQMVLNAPQYYRHFIETVCKPGDETTMYLTNKRPKRSAAQNNYYHLYLSLISLSSGHTVKELKTWTKGKFLSKGISEVFGDKVRVVENTSDLNISEFLEFMDRIEEHTEIPLPPTANFIVALTQEEYDTLKEEQKIKYQSLKPRIEPVDNESSTHTE